MIKIGLIGEDPNDTDAFKNLFKNEFNKKYIFKSLLNGIRGYQLDNPKTKKSFEVEIKNNNFINYIFIRDLDGFRSEKHKISKVTKWFNELNKICQGKGILLLNIWEFEALIFADIETFYNIYNIKNKTKFNKNVEFISNPKEELKRISKQGNKIYFESDLPRIFEKLNFSKIKKNCKYFKEFTQHNLFLDNI